MSHVVDRLLDSDIDDVVRTHLTECADCADLASRLDTVDRFAVAEVSSKGRSPQRWYAALTASAALVIAALALLTSDTRTFAPLAGVVDDLSPASSIRFRGEDIPRDSYENEPIVTLIEMSSDGQRIVRQRYGQSPVIRATGQEILRTGDGYFLAEADGCTYDPPRILYNPKLAPGDELTQTFTRTCGGKSDVIEFTQKNEGREIFPVRGGRLEVYRISDSLKWGDVTVNEERWFSLDWIGDLKWRKQRLDGSIEELSAIQVLREGIHTDYRTVSAPITLGRGTAEGRYWHVFVQTLDGWVCLRHLSTTVDNKGRSGGGGCAKAAGPEPFPISVSWYPTSSEEVGELPARRGTSFSMRADPRVAFGRTGINAVAGTVTALDGRSVEFSIRRIGAWKFFVVDLPPRFFVDNISFRDESGSTIHTEPHPARDPRFQGEVKVLGEQEMRTVGKIDGLTIGYLRAQAEICFDVSARRGPSMGVCGLTPAPDALMEVLISGGGARKHDQVVAGLSAERVARLEFVTANGVSKAVSPVGRGAGHGRGFWALRLGFDDALSVVHAYDENGSVIARFRCEGADSVCEAV